MLTRIVQRGIFQGIYFQTITLLHETPPTYQTYPPAPPPSFRTRVYPNMRVSGLLAQGVQSVLWWPRTCLRRDSVRQRGEESTASKSYTAKPFSPCIRLLVPLVDLPIASNVFSPAPVRCIRHPVVLTLDTRRVLTGDDNHTGYISKARRTAHTREYILEPILCKSMRARGWFSKYWVRVCP